MALTPDRVDPLPWAEHLALLGWDCPDGVSAVRVARGRPVSGTRLDWTGPGEAGSWRLDAPVDARRTYGGEVWARLDGVPVISRVRLPGEAFLHLGLKANGSPGVAAALRRLLIEARGACAWLDLRGVVVPRMDDPGCCASVYFEGWRFEGLDEAGYAAIGEVARRHDARISVGFTPGWVDDGDPDGGELQVDGRLAERVAGAIHPSSRVEYRAADGLTADGPGTRRGLEALDRLGVGTVELHGYTHVHPDRERWAVAESGRRKVGWFKEFAPENAASRNGAPDDRVERGLELFAESFDRQPVALICPGEAWNPKTVDEAHRQGLEMFCADWLGVRNGHGFTRLSGVAVTSLESGAALLPETDGPVVAGFHDRDVALHGPEWLDRAFESWRRAGATRFADLDELSSALGLRVRLDRRGGEWLLAVDRARGVPLPRPFPVALRFDGPAPETIAVEGAGDAFETEVEDRDKPAARVMLPAGL